MLTEMICLPNNTTVRSYTTLGKRIRKIIINKTSLKPIRESKLKIYNTEHRYHPCLWNATRDISPYSCSASRRGV